MSKESERRANMIVDVARETADASEIDVLQREVIASGEGFAAYLFARDIDGADIERLQEVVVASGNALAIRLFSEHIPGAESHIEREVGKFLG